MTEYECQNIRGWRHWYTYLLYVTYVKYLSAKRAIGIYDDEWENLNNILWGFEISTLSLSCLSTAYSHNENQFVRNSESNYSQFFPIHPLSHWWKGRTRGGRTEVLRRVSLECEANAKRQKFECVLKFEVRQVENPDRDDFGKFLDH